MDISNGMMLGLSVIALVMIGSVVVYVTPEVLSFDCNTPDQQWVENGTLYIGNQIEC